MVTIVILLILAGVSINLVLGENGLISRAQEAVLKTEESQEEEQRQFAMYEASMSMENQPYIDENGDNVTIPAGFAVSQVEGENTIEDGLVIIDSDGNEFVWIPVDNINRMARETIGIDDNGYKNYEGILYDFDGTILEERENYGQGTTEYREPDVISDYDSNSDYLQIIKDILTDQTTRYTDIDTFKKTMQEDYNEMVKSVAKYGGFYIGRYEISKADNRVQSKPKSIALTTVNNNSNEDVNGNTWFGLYAYGKKYNTTSVASSMVWGSQYDAMMIWMMENGVNVTEANDSIKNNNSSITGPDGDKDVIKNVYDLYGGRREWTLEATTNSFRGSRGGGYYATYAPSSHNYGNPNHNNSGYSTRFTLYIK